MHERLTKLLTLHEGEQLKVYRCPAGKLTIGVGRNLEDLGITVSESRYLLANDILRVARELDESFPWWRGFSDVRQAVLIDMCFNLGMPRLKGFRLMLAAIEGGDWSEAARQMRDSKWAADVKTRADRLITMMETDQWPSEMEGSYVHDYRKGDNR